MPVVALAWKADARVPATRVGLNAIVAQTAQAEFAQKCPDVIWSPSCSVRHVHDEG